MQRCVYCTNAAATTRDHVPPRNLFPPPRPSNLIVVPSCRACNAEFAKDDEYFRLAMATPAGTGDFPGIEQVYASIGRSLSRPAASGFAAMVSESIVHSSESHGVTIQIDRARISRVGRRLARALYYVRFGEILGPHVAVKASTRFWPKTVRMVYLYHQLEQQPVAEIGDGAFGHQVLRLPEHPEATFWFFHFFRQTRMFALTDPRLPSLYRPSA